MHIEDRIHIPKGFLTGIEVTEGPWAGQIAQPCMCGYPVDFDDTEPIYLVQWNDGRLMYCHESCSGAPPENA